VDWGINKNYSILITKKTEKNKILRLLCFNGLFGIFSYLFPNYKTKQKIYMHMYKF